MKTINFQRLIIISLVLLCAHTTQAQVTVGSDIPPTRAALMEIKTQQDNSAFTSVIDDENITSTTGGFLLPRVKLVSKNTLEPFIATTDADYIANTDNLKERLAGLMVYNLTNNGVLYPGLYTWDGEKWMTSQANLTFGVIEEPKSFTFYETGTEAVQPLKFEVDGDGAPFTYQWYVVTGNNVHVRIGEPVTQGTGSNTDSYVPTQVIKGTTMNANNTGFYKFYCIAENTYGQKLESQIAEVAVGCGAKNNAGEWISFMCFNLGAQNGITIQQQKDYSVGIFTNNADGVTSRHTYIVGEENVWGNLFQWGRIPDGHQNNNPALNNQNYSGMSTTQIVNGSRCITTEAHRPYYQVGKTSVWYGKFIFNAENWNPSTQSVADQLWRTGRFLSNDPCAHYKTDGTYQEFWHEGADGVSAGIDACVDVGTNWRTPSQDEWGAIYRGGAISSSPSTATANTWEWYDGTATNYSRGYEIRPDGYTTTLFLPAGGYRHYTSGQLHNQGEYGHYGTVNSVSTNSAYIMNFGKSHVNSASSVARAIGNTLRCIKN